MKNDSSMFCMTKPHTSTCVRFIAWLCDVTVFAAVIGCVSRVACDVTNARMLHAHAARMVATWVYLCSLTVSRTWRTLNTPRRVRCGVPSCRVDCLPWTASCFLSWESTTRRSSTTALNTLSCRFASGACAELVPSAFFSIYFPAVIACGITKWPMFFFLSIENAFLLFLIPGWYRRWSA